VDSNVEPTVVGLPDDFELTREQAAALAIDDTVAAISLRHGLFEALARFSAARDAASERGDGIAANAYQLLLAVSGMALSDEPRAPFGRYMAGHLEDGTPWHTPLPADLRDGHVHALTHMLEATTTPILRARIADILWHRVPRRNPQHAREAIRNYLDVADATFTPEHWVDSDQHFSRAVRLARQLGVESPEFRDVMATAWRFLERLRDNDPLYYTERIVSRLLDAFSAEQSVTLFDRMISIAEGAQASADFERARTYYDVAIRLAQRLQREDVRALRITRAETFVTQALAAPNETHRALFLRIARQELLNSGAARERLTEVARLLDEAQTLSVSEMTAIGTSFSAGAVPDHVRALLTDREPIEALWLLAGLPLLLKQDDARQSAERSVARHTFAYGFRRRHVSRDGREQGRTPGAIGSGESEGEAVVRGAMREHAARSRIYATVAGIEPARHELLLSHDYTLTEIYDALRSRPLIPQGHLLLWAKGIYAGLVGEFDVAVHVLAPQLENALREILRRRGEIVYTTRDGVQSLMSIENVLNHPLMVQICGDDHIFALETVLSERLGANVRNDVAHGIVNDISSNSPDTVYLWWLALRLLRAYGADPLAPAET